MSQGKLKSEADAIAALEGLVAVFLRRRQALAASEGLTELQWQTLESVADTGFMPSLFARSRSTTAAAVSKVLRQLLERGLVESRVAEEDARQRAYRLTEQGAAALERIDARRRRAVEATWAKVPARDLRAFERVARRVTEELEEHENVSADDVEG